MGVTIGMFLGTGALTLITSLISMEAFVAWGWRVPFILSALLVVFGFWIRKGIDETPDFQELKDSGDVVKVPLFETLKTHWREVLISIGAKVVETAPFYIFGTFVISYATNQLSFTYVQALIAVMIATIVTTILIPIMGSLSDKIGRKKMYVYGAVAMMLYAFPYFLLLHQETFATLLISTVIGLGIIWAPITAVLGTMFSEIFDAKVRYTGVTLGYQIGAANSWIPIAIYIILTAVISLLSVWAIRDKSKKVQTIQTKEI